MLERTAPHSPITGLLSVFVIAVLSLSLLTACGARERKATEAFEAAQASYAQAAASLEERNSELDAAIEGLTQAMASKKTIDNATLAACEQAIGAAQGARKEAPAMAETTVEINAQVAAIEAVNYSEQLKALEEAMAAVESAAK